MQRRRYIAFLLAAVYLWTVGSVALMALCCSCQGHRGQACCKTDCCHLHRCVPQSDCLHYEADCCCDQHANPSLLYTFVVDDEVRRTFPQTLLFEALLADTVISDGRLFGSKLDPTGPPLLPLSSGCHVVRTLRAPPVMA